MSFLFFFFSRISTCVVTFASHSKGFSGEVAGVYGKVEKESKLIEFQVNLEVIFRISGSYHHGIVLPLLPTLSHTHIDKGC